MSSPGDEVDPPQTLSVASAGRGAGVISTDSAGALEPGTRVGRFVVVTTAGHGGMGVVYAAYDPELDRKIALKLLRVGATDSTSASEGRLRLQREAQAMARLAHPNVVTVHDVGVFGEQVFLAMEFVDGRTLTEWLREKPRQWKDVLPVFTQAAQGLAAAHAAGIIHRDFKPSNVLIGQDGRVRVMDFGVARAANDAEATTGAQAQTPREGSSGTVLLEVSLTRLGAIVGTPGYMAPEQLEGREVDARTDQYAFCVALYEALYGERPFKGPSVDELRVSMLTGCVVEAPKESKVPAWLRRAVLHGLAVNPAERYADMKALIDALGKDPSIKRRKWAIAASALLMVGAVALMSRAWVRHQSLLCKGAATKLGGVWNAERRRAVQEAFEATGKSYAADTAARVAQALDDYAAQWIAMHTEACEATQVRGEQSAALLDLRMACLEGRLKEARALVEVFTQADAKVVEKAVQAAYALPRLSRCADKQALTAVMPPPEDKAVQTKVEELRDKLIEAKALEEAGKYAAGLESAVKAAEQAKQLDYAPVAAEALYRLGSLQQRSGAFESAEQSLREAWLAAEAADHGEIEAEAVISLTFVVGYRLGRLQEAEQLGRHAGAVVKRLPDKHELEADWLNNVGVVFWSKGDYAKAGEYHRRALAVREKVVGPAHLAVATSLNNLGLALCDMGDYDQAREYHERALAIREKALGPEHPEVAKSLNNLGLVLMETADYDKAQEYHERALSILKKALGPEHPDVATLSLNNLGELFLRKGDYRRAEEYYERALPIAGKALGPEHPEVATILTNLGEAHLGQSAYDKAEKYVKRGLAIREKVLGPKHPRVATSLGILGAVCEKKGDYERAYKYCAQVLSLCRSIICEPGVVPLAAFSVAKALARAGRDPGRALELAEQAHDLYAKLPGKNKELAEVEAWLAKHRR